MITAHPRIPAPGMSPVGEAPGTPAPVVDPAKVPQPVPASELVAGERWCRAMSITVDGPAGSGKSTIARLVAETLGFAYVETGATYRALGWLALERDLPLDDGARLRGLAIAQPTTLGWGEGRWEVEIAGVDVTDAIREPHIDDAASRVASHPEVRDVLIARQRQLSLDRDSVLDGRDCGTVVRPEADLKVYVTADLAERARRRGGQFDAGDAARHEGDVAAELEARDRRDAAQSAAADDAIVLDTTAMDIETGVARVIDAWRARRRELLDDEVIAGRTARAWISNEQGQAHGRRTLDRTSAIWRRGFRLQAHGVERVPAESCIFIANHSSVFDPAFLMTPLDRVIRYMGKEELTRTPIFGKMGMETGLFPVRRGAGDRVALYIAEESLRGGDSLGLFPEGTRIHEGRLARPRLGAARLALVTGVPIVPVAIYGNRWAESLFRVTVAFGRPHPTTGMRATPENIRNLTIAAWDDVYELWSSLKADRWF